MKIIKRKVLPLFIALTVTIGYTNSMSGYRVFAEGGTEDGAVENLLEETLESTSDSGISVSTEENNLVGKSLEGEEVSVVITEEYVNDGVIKLNPGRYSMEENFATINDGRIELTPGDYTLVGKFKSSGIKTLGSVDDYNITFENFEHTMSSVSDDRISFEIKDGDNVTITLADGSSNDLNVINGILPTIVLSDNSNVTINGNETLGVLRVHSIVGKEGSKAGNITIEGVKLNVGYGIGVGQGESINNLNILNSIIEGSSINIGAANTSSYRDISINKINISGSKIDRAYGIGSENINVSDRAFMTIGEINITKSDIKNEGRIGLSNLGEIGTINIVGGKLESKHGIGSGLVESSTSSYVEDFDLTKLSSHVGTINISGGPGDYIKSGVPEYGSNPIWLDHFAFIGSGSVKIGESIESEIKSTVGSINIKGENGYLIDLNVERSAAIGSGRAESWTSEEIFTNFESKVGSINISGDDGFNLIAKDNEDLYSSMNRSAIIGTSESYNGSSSVGSIVISGGNITVESNSPGAAIGTAGMGLGSSGGDERHYIGSIEITGGKVTAKNYKSGPGIGTGDASHHQNLNHVPNEDGTYGREPKSDAGSYIENITISGGDVLAIGGKFGAAGIGTGLSVSRFTQKSYWENDYVSSEPRTMEYVNNINITGGEVVAIGGKSGGAGIGKSFAEENTVGSLTIGEGASVKAYAVSDFYDRIVDPMASASDSNNNFYMIDYRNNVYGTSADYLPPDKAAFEKTYGYEPQSRYAIGIFDGDEGWLNGNIVNTYLTDSIYYEDERDFEYDYMTGQFHNMVYDTIKITAYEIDGEGKIELELPYGYTSFSYNAPEGTEFVHVYEDKLDNNKKKALKVIDEKEQLSKYRGQLIVPTLSHSNATWLGDIELLETPVISEMYEGYETIQGTGTSGMENLTVNLEIITEDKSIFVNSIPVVDGKWSIDIADIPELKELKEGYKVLATQAKEEVKEEITEVVALSLQTKGYVKVYEPVVGNTIAGDKVISGTSKPKANILVTINGVEFSTTAEEEGNWSVDIGDVELAVGEKIIAKQIIKAVDGEKIESKIGNTIVLRRPEKPEILEVREGDTEIRGTSEPNAVVIVTINAGNYNEKVIETTANKDGEWVIIDLDKLDANAKILANQTVEVKTDVFATSYDGETVAIPLENLDKPFINEAMEGDKEITGTALPGSTVEVTINQGEENEQVFETVADENGNWVVVVEDGLVEGEKIVANQSIEDEKGNLLVSDNSDEVIVKAAPEIIPPIIREIKVTDKVITGNGIIGATVKVILDEEKDIFVTTEVVQGDTVTRKGRSIANDGTWTINLDGIENFKLEPEQLVYASQKLVLESELVSTKVIGVEQPIDPPGPFLPPPTGGDPDDTEEEDENTDPTPVGPTDPTDTGNTGDPTDPGDTTDPGEEDEPEQPEIDTPFIPTENPEDPEDTFLPVTETPEVEEVEIVVPDDAPFVAAERGEDGLVYLFDDFGVPLGTVTFDDYIVGNFDNMIPFGAAEVEAFNKANPKTGTTSAYPIVGLIILVAGGFVIFSQRKRLLNK